jgi:hypothetical protein
VTCTGVGTDPDTLAVNVTVLPVGVKAADTLMFVPLCHRQFHLRRLLLIRLLGLRAVLRLVNFFFIPFIRAQKEVFRDPPSGCGRFKFIP